MMRSGDTTKTLLFQSAAALAAALWLVAVPFTAVAETPPPPKSDPAAQSEAADPAGSPNTSAQSADAAPKAEEPMDRAALLEQLYDRLAAETDPEAAQVLELAVQKVWGESGSDTVDLLMERTTVLQEAGDVDLAIKLLETVTELQPDYAEAYNRRAYIFYAAGDTTRALEDLQRTLAIDQRHYQAITGLGTILRELGDDKAALRAFRKALEIHPNMEAAKQAEEALAREVEGQGI